VKERWTAVATEVEGKTLKQCVDRWANTVVVNVDRFKELAGAAQAARTKHTHAD
jgi:hypothetical protein